MALTSNQRQYLKGLAHELNPVVMIGNNSLTESVLEEIKTSLDHHELIKIKVNELDRDQRELIILAITRKTQSELVQTIGKVMVIYKISDKQKIELPKPRRPRIQK